MAETTPGRFGHASPVAPIPKRESDATPQLVDLSNYYNAALDDDIHHKPGNTLLALPRGIQRFGGTPFDVRGVIQLAGKRSAEITGLVFPEAVRGIPVHVKGHKLHCLHATAWSDKEGTRIGAYVLSYAGGRTATVPILYQWHAVDWWYSPADKSPTAAEVVWTGDSERTRSMGFKLRLMKFTWQNPSPDVEIQNA